MKASLTRIQAERHKGASGPVHCDPIDAGLMAHVDESLKYKDASA